MKRFLSMAQGFDYLGVSKTRYYEMRNPKSEWYDPEVPQPINAYDDAKLRFYSEDVEKYVEQKMLKIRKAA